MRYRIAILLATGAVVALFVVFYVATSYPEYLYLAGSPPRCQFADQLTAAIVESVGRRQDAASRTGGAGFSRSSARPAAESTAGGRLPVISESTVGHRICSIAGIAGS